MSARIADDFAAIRQGMRDKGLGDMLVKEDPPEDAWTGIDTAFQPEEDDDATAPKVIGTRAKKHKAVIGQKVVPSLKTWMLGYGKGLGEISPQIFGDWKTGLCLAGISERRQIRPFHAWKTRLMPSFRKKPFSELVEIYNQSLTKTLESMGYTVNPPSSKAP